MRTKFANLLKHALLIGAVMCCLFLSCTKKEEKISLSKDDILVLTENAFLQGYKAALLKQDNDSVWNKISKTYVSVFK